MDAFNVIRTVRSAIYGDVVLVQHKLTQRLYAMKRMSLTHMTLQCAVSGPRVQEDGEAELQILRRLGNNTTTTNEEVEAYDGSQHPHWHHPTPLTASEQHFVLMLHMDFVVVATNCRCLVMDYCPQGELYDQLTQSTGFTLSRARQCFSQLITAIRFLHEHHIAHRDVSLENILVDEKDNCRLADFGLASEHGQVCHGRVGKVFYMAPEVFANQTYNGLKADMWSLGIVLFLLLTNVPPFETPSEQDARFRLVQTSGISALLKLWHMDRKVPPIVCELLDQLLCVDPMKRLDIEAVCAHKWLQDDETAEDAPSKSPTRARKRMRIMIADDVTSDASYDSPSRDQAFTAAPHASPMVWRKAGVRTALRSLFRKTDDDKDH